MARKWKCRRKNHKPHKKEIATHLHIASINRKSTTMITTQSQAILGRDYPKSKVNRADAARFSTLLRGSIRLMRRLFRTEDEQEA
jgi:uncharacterized protein YfaP (DUF2135 family)